MSRLIATRSPHDVLDLVFSRARKRRGTCSLPCTWFSTTWIRTEVARLIDSTLKGAGGSWDAEINGYQFSTAGALVLEIMLPTREDDLHNKQTKLGKEHDAPNDERLTWLPRDGGLADGGATRIDERLIGAE